MIQARTLADRSPVGAFILTEGDSNYRLACDNNVRPCSYHLFVLNSIFYRLLPPIDLKTSVSVMWIAPTAGTDAISYK